MKSHVNLFHSFIITLKFTLPLSIKLSLCIITYEGQSIYRVHQVITVKEEEKTMDGREGKRKVKKKDERKQNSSP